VEEHGVDLEGKGSPFPAPAFLPFTASAWTLVASKRAKLIMCPANIDLNYVKAS